ncbi:Polyisoprenoid-binding protein YceI [Streptomyces sp. WMMB 714]|uniref:YceI family protein n=1 Tax=Streptomyces sp. WMMB 714 TaxID=1286822 RepID=UPI0005F78263|nr:YceI family protein [Streptomyces sp. WMMB 714]SCK19828.1 Polyisoprenoid-binding protein YceI [Streptomyces sp. WMMB 714]
MTAPALGRYAIDPAGSVVRFTTRHLFGLAPVHGTFAVKRGTVDVTEPLAESAVRVEVETASFDTGNRTRDETVRSGRFLDARRYPLMTFQAERVHDAAVAGTLTAREISRPVDLSVELIAVSRREFTVRATTRIDRTAFGVTGSRGMTGRYLDVTAEVRCVRA